MELFLCDMCNEQLRFEQPHICDPAKIKERIRALEMDTYLANKRLWEMQNAVLMIIQELPSLEGESTTVKTEWLRRLWGATKCQWYKAKTSEKFFSIWFVTHRILCEAYNLFKSKRYGEVKTTLEKLTALKKACVNSQKVLGYKDSVLDLKPEDLIDQ